MIRLSTAHAKARQSEEVEEYDCVEVMKVLKFALEHDTGVVEDDDEEEEEEKSEGDVEETAAAKKKRQQQQRSRRAATERKEKEDADMQEEEEEVTAPTTPSKRKRTTPATTTSAPSSAKRRARSAASDSTMADSDETDEKVSDAYVVVAPAQVVLAQERIDEFRKALVAYMRSLRADSVQVSQIIRSLNSRQGSVAFDEQEVDAILAQLEAANAVMYRNGIVYRV